jgi:hypothetical protein
MRCTRSTGSAVRVSSSPGTLRSSSYMSSATDASRSSLNFTLNCLLLADKHFISEGDIVVQFYHCAVDSFLIDLT